MDLPTGFRFHPTDEELIYHYLKPKVLLSSSDQPIFSIIADVNIYKFNPWELPDKACFGEEEWFFFSPRERKYPNGTRPNRAAASGFWKASGVDKPIITSVGSQCLGMKRALMFYKGRPPKGVKTDWVMTEYRLLDDHLVSHRPKGSMRLDDWVLCRVSHKGKVPQQVRGTGRSSNSCLSSSCSPPLLRGYLQGQEMLTQNTIVQATDSHTPTSQTTIDADSRQVLNSIARVLSVGAFDELFGSSSNNNGNASVFQISSPAQSFSDV